MRTFSKNEAARHLGVTNGTVDRWRKKGFLSAKKMLNGRVMFDADQVDEFKRVNSEGFDFDDVEKEGAK